MSTRLTSTAALIAAGLISVPAHAADLRLTAELPTVATSMTRFDASRDEVLPIVMGGSLLAMVPWRPRVEVFYGPTVRGGRSAIQAPMLQLRLDSGLHWNLGEGERASPFLELSSAFESLWLSAPDGLHYHTGVGPALAFGARMGSHDRVTVLGARLTSAWLFGGEEFVSHTVHDDEGDYAYSYRPSNLTLALFAGRRF
jgi:hypothetical protein